MFDINLEQTNQKQKQDDDKKIEDDFDISGCPRIIIVGVGYNQNKISFCLLEPSYSEKMFFYLTVSLGRPPRVQFFIQFLSGKIFSVERPVIRNS